MVEFAEDLPLGPGGGGGAGCILSIEELGAPLVVPDELVIGRVFIAELYPRTEPCFVQGCKTQHFQVTRSTPFLLWSGPCQPACSGFSSFELALNQTLAQVRLSNNLQQLIIQSGPDQHLWSTREDGYTD